MVRVCTAMPCFARLEWQALTQACRAKSGLRIPRSFSRHTYVCPSRATPMFALLAPHLCLPFVRTAWKIGCCAPSACLPESGQDQVSCCHQDVCCADSLLQSQAVSLPTVPLTAPPLHIVPTLHMVPTLQMLPTLHMVLTLVQIVQCLNRRLQFLSRNNYISALPSPSFSLHF
jgi:hypothetical protein